MKHYVCLFFNLVNICVFRFNSDMKLWINLQLLLHDARTVPGSVTDFTDDKKKKTQKSICFYCLILCQGCKDSFGGGALCMRV